MQSRRYIAQGILGSSKRRLSFVDAHLSKRLMKKRVTTYIRLLKITGHLLLVTSLLFQSGEGANAHRAANSTAPRLQKRMKPNKHQDAAKTLFEAASRGDAAAIERLIRGRAAVNEKDERGRTPLFYAATNGKGDPATVQALLRAGADVNARDRSGATALLEALDPGGTTPNVAALLETGADVNIPDLGGDTPLIRASSWGATHLVRMLLDRDADPNVKRLDGRSALMVAAKLGHVATTRLLIARGAEVLARDNQGNTALALVETEYRASAQNEVMRRYFRASWAAIMKLLRDAAKDR